MTTSIRIETLAALRSSQTVWPEWMAQVTRNLADTDEVEVTRRHEPFGTYVIHIKPATREVTMLATPTTTHLSHLEPHQRIAWPSQTARPDQRAQVARYVTLDPYGRGESCVTGIVTDEDATYLVIRMYSAGCLHNGYVLPRAALLSIEPDPR